MHQHSTWLRKCVTRTTVLKLAPCRPLYRRSADRFATLPQRQAYADAWLFAIAIASNRASALVSQKLCQGMGRIGPCNHLSSSLVAVSRTVCVHVSPKNFGGGRRAWAPFVYEGAGRVWAIDTCHMCSVPNLVALGQTVGCSYIYIYRFNNTIHNAHARYHVTSRWWE